MKLDAAIRTALEHEGGVHKAYLYAMEQTADPAGKRVFAALAEEEMGHIKYLNSRLQEWQQTGKINLRELKTSIPNREVINKSLAGLRRTVKPKSTALDPELALLKKALEVERKTSLFYKQMVATLDGDGQKLFQRFVEIEEGHEAIVQAEIDSVSNCGIYMGNLEFGLEVS